MAKLIDAMLTSLDGHTEASKGNLGRGAEDPDVHTYIGDAFSIRAGLVDEYHLFVTTTVAGGGTRFFPDGVRLDLELVEHHAFANGLIHVRYRTP